jgi:CRP-like cAMP-binding protein
MLTMGNSNRRHCCGLCGKLTGNLLLEALFVLLRYNSRRGVETKIFRSIDLSNYLSQSVGREAAAGGGCRTRNTVHQLGGDYIIGTARQRVQKIFREVKQAEEVEEGKEKKERSNFR